MNNIRRTLLYLGSLTVLLLFSGYLLGGARGIGAAFLFALALPLLAFGWSGKRVLRTYRAEPLSAESAPEVFAILRELCGQIQLPIPRVYWIPSAAPNAFATGCGRRRASIVLTQGAVEMLNREELAGVLAHELVHVENGDILLSSLTFALASVLGLFTSGVKGMFWVGSARDPKGESTNPIVFLTSALLLPLSALLIQLGISKSREYEADQKAGDLCGNPLYLASALAKLEAGSKRFPMHQAEPAAAHLFILSPLKGKMALLFRTHPPIEERIARLEEAARAMERR